MTASRSPATPDLMALICLIGGAMRGVWGTDFLTKLVLIGTFSRPLGQALDAWLLVEERYADREFYLSNRNDEDGWGGEDEFRKGWDGKLGRVALWRHVTRFGLAVLVPIQWGDMIREPEPPVATRSWSVARLLAGLSFFRIFSPASSAAPSLDLFVPLSKHYSASIIRKS